MVVLIMEVGVGEVAFGMSWKNHTTGYYQQWYLRTWTIALAFAAVYVLGPTIIGSFIPVSKYIPEFTRVISN